MWWRVVGSALEHAAHLNGQVIDFKDQRARAANPDYAAQGRQRAADARTDRKEYRDCKRAYLQRAGLVVLSVIVRLLWPKL